MRVLITGGAGFIGSHLAEAWIARGAEVVILDSLRSGNESNVKRLDCRFVCGCVTDGDTVRACMDGVDYVHHLAAMVSVPESMEKPRECEAINVGGILNVLEAARDAGAKKVIFSSTSAVYGMIDRPIHRETDLPDPVSPYAITKLASEHFLEMYRRQFGLPTVSLRYFNVYGPRQDPDSAYAAAIAAFVNRAVEGKPLTIYGDGEQTRDFIHVSDVVAANILAAEQAEGVFNVSCGERITINDLAQTVVRQARSESKILHGPARAGDVRHSRGEATKLKELGWAPRIPLESGLRELIADARR